MNLTKIRKRRIQNTIKYLALGIAAFCFAWQIKDWKAERDVLVDSIDTFELYLQQDAIELKKIKAKKPIDQDWLELHLDIMKWERDSLQIYYERLFDFDNSFKGRVVATFYQLDEYEEVRN